jgi:hypothetical protein
METLNVYYYAMLMASETPSQWPEEDKLELLEEEL